MRTATDFGKPLEVWDNTLISHSYCASMLLVSGRSSVTRVNRVQKVSREYVSNTKSWSEGITPNWVIVVDPRGNSGIVSPSFPTGKEKKRGKRGEKDLCILRGWLLQKSDHDIGYCKNECCTKLNPNKVTIKVFFSYFIEIFFFKLTRRSVSGWLSSSNKLYIQYKD